MAEYEYLFDMPELLKEKPLDAAYIMKRAVDSKLAPTAVRVDNEKAAVFFYFNQPLEKDQKKALDSMVKELFQEWKKR